MTIPRRALTATVVAAAALATGASGASGAVLALPAGLCDRQAFSTPFAALGDTAAYAPVPGGDFEGKLTGWTLTGGAATVTDRVDNLGKGGDTRALSLPVGATATSALMCVTTDYPYFRFFTRSKSTSILSNLRVDVIYEATTPVTVIPVALLNGSKMGAWQATPQLTTGVVLATIAANLSAAQQILAGTKPIVGAGPMRVRVTAIGGVWEADSLYVDPRMR
ncbi:MAG: hypothetical protein IT200_11415 [Thermoleophilia bacterium]|nr:hypothetical protein [Thermoleophilia bacterium]